MNTLGLAAALPLLLLTGGAAVGADRFAEVEAADGWVYRLNLSTMIGSREGARGATVTGTAFAPGQSFLYYFDCRGRYVIQSEGGDWQRFAPRSVTAALSRAACSNPPSRVSMEE